MVYSALDQEFAEPVLKDQASKAGIAVRAKFDVESTKTVGLTNTLIAEAVQPRCDLFWNNEILNTIRLKEHGAARSRSGRRTPTTCPLRSGTRTGPGTGSRPGPGSSLVNTQARCRGRPALRAWPTC